MNLTFLKNIGKVVLTATKIVNGYGPVVAQIIPGTRDDAAVHAIGDKLDQAAGVVVGAELFGQALLLPGADKAKAAAPAMFQVLMGLKMISGRKLKNLEAARAAAQRVGADLADFLNAFED